MAKTHKKTILVMYYTRGVFPLRDTINSHLYCWENYSKHRVIYVNIALGFPERIIAGLQLDVIIFHTLFLGMRWTREIFTRYVQRCRILATVNCIKIAIPQDEFLNTDLLNTFVLEFGITHILTMAEPGDARKIYNEVDFGRVSAKRVLAGYIDPNTLQRIQKKKSRIARRDIDIGYRAWRAAFWLGEHGTHKVRVAEAVEDAARKLGLKCDISFAQRDVLAGDEWFDFLLKCRATLGAEGGATVLDRDGEIKKSVEQYLSHNSSASFEEVKNHCFPNQDHAVNLVVITPRHFEACMTETLQFLVEGRYNDVLLPWRHYVPIKRDYSNVGEVLEVLRDKSVMAEIISNGYREIACSDKWTYPGFVREIEECIIDKMPWKTERRRTFRDLFSYSVLRLHDALCWQFIRFERWVLDGGTRRKLPRLFYNVVVRLPGRF